jgi:hypothetical protein
MAKRIWTRDEINALLRKDDSFVERSIIKLGDLQTDDEKRDGDTKWHNTVGFSSADARPGIRFYRWLKGMNDKNVVCFAPKSLSHPRAAKVFRRYCRGNSTPMDRARKIALKHSRQLVDIANGTLERK